MLASVDLRDLLTVIAIFLMAAGAAMIYLPAAFMLTGMLLFILAVLPLFYRPRSG